MHYAFNSQSKLHVEGVQWSQYSRSTSLVCTNDGKCNEEFNRLTIYINTKRSVVSVGTPVMQHWLCIEYVIVWQLMKYSLSYILIS